MPTYTNPQTIDLNTQKSAPELQSNFDAIQAALNGGLDEVNVPNLAAAFTTWKTIKLAAAQIPTQGAGGTFLMPHPTVGTIAAQAAAGSAPWAFRLDPADHAANARTTKIRIRSTVITNGVAPATNFVTELRPVVTTGGVSGAAPGINTVGAVVVSNAHNTPGATTLTTLDSTEANFPAAGPFCFTVTVGAAMAAGSQIAIAYELQMRQV